MTQNGSTNVIAVYLHGARRAIIRVGCKLYFEQQTFYLCHLMHLCRLKLSMFCLPITILNFDDFGIPLLYNGCCLNFS